MLVRPLKDILFEQVPPSGTSVELECELSHPNCRVQWLRAEKIVPIGKKYEFIPEGCVYRLRISDVNLDDMDTYQMIYKNLKTKALVDAKGGLFLSSLMYHGNEF